MSDDQNFILARDLLAAKRRDPETAARMDAQLAANLREQAIYRQRAMMRIFDDVIRAQSLPPGEAAKVLDGTVAMILDDPGLTYTLTQGFEEAMDEPAQQVRDALLDAADPVSGQLPPGFRLPDELQDVLDGDPDLQHWRDTLPEIIRGDVAGTAARVADYMAPILDDLFARRRIAQEWSDHDVAAGLLVAGQAEVLEPLVTRGDEEPDTAEPLPGTATTRYATAEGELYRLAETRIYEGDDQYTVRLRLLGAGTPQPLVGSRDEWVLYASLYGQRLPVAPDEDYEDAWQIANYLGAADLASITYEVELLRPD